MTKTKREDVLSKIIVVVVIIVVLSGILIPGITGYISKSMDVRAKDEVSEFIKAYDTWLDERRDYEKDFKNYCISLGLMDQNSENQNVEQRVMAGNKLDYDHGFVYHATNGRLVIYTYNSETNKSNIIISRAK